MQVLACAPGFAWPILNRIASPDSSRWQTHPETSNPEFAFKVGQVVIKIDPTYFRPTEVDLLIGDPTKSKTKLGWLPKYDLKSLVAEMIAEDVKLFQRDIHLVHGGHDVVRQPE